MGAVFSTEEGIRKLAREVSLPDVVGYVASSADGAKDKVFEVIARETREFLSNLNLTEEIAKLLTTLSFEIKTEIRFIPNSERLIGSEPDVKASVRLKRADRDDGKDKDKERDERDSRSRLRFWRREDETGEGRDDDDGDGALDYLDPGDVAPDGDGDGVPDDRDVCPLTADPPQVDTDGDGDGDACDVDANGDGYLDEYELRGGGLLGCASGASLAPLTAAALAALMCWRRRRR
jgi:hypothetical protein